MKHLFIFLSLAALASIGFLACSQSEEKKKKYRVATLSNIDSLRPRPTRIDTVDYSAKDSVDYALFTLIESTLWDTLKDLKYESKGSFGYIPRFGAKQKALAGKRIVIEGYMYPLENDKVQKWFMLSYFPAASCFFCGAAGPETVVEINSPQGIPVNKDKKLKISGVMTLNSKEPERLFYIINEARLVE
jgi:hypothetical protein